MIIYQQKRTTKTYLLILSIIILLSISACSPHPGAGTWITDGNNTLKLSKIVIVFEGTADFFSATIKPETSRNNQKSKEKMNDAIRRCFWGASSDNEIQMQCVHAENTDIKEAYQFTIIEKDQAQLTQNEQLIALFKREK